MPELPEIETVRMQLEKVLVGQISTKCELLSTKVVRGDINKIVGKRVVGVERRGKVLLISFGKDLKLGFHFKMTGQLIYEKTKILNPKNQINTKNQILNRIVGGHPTEDFVNKMPSSHTRVIFEFVKDAINTSPALRAPSPNLGEGNRSKLYFNDQRLFGWIEINPKFVDKLGPEPFDITPDEFAQRISKTKRQIKVVLMDQEIISGVGNIYANDALWEAGIDPRTPIYHLTFEHLSLLLEKLKLVLREGIKYGGATAADAKYMNLHGLGGHYQEHFRVYDRENLPCKRCGTKIKKFVLGGRGTYYCPACQC